MNLFTYDKPLYKITKPIRLIELFAGYGSQSLALKYLGIEHENYKVVEFDKYAIQSYNEIHDTDFPLLDITEIKGKDLEIKDTDKYEYIMTYSFPCQDLSLAGKGAGMSVGTRSGLLWEVERLLNEVEELPQILLMENVPQVIGKKNIEHFSKWVEFLESKGYSNFHQNLIATDYGIPQTRNRTFMISILGDYNYNFPSPIKLELKLKDMLEDNVDEKYYLSEKAIKGMLETNYQQGKYENRVQKDICSTIMARDYKDAKCVEVFDFRYDEGIRGRVDTEMCPTITCKTGSSGISGQPLLKIPEATKKGYAEATNGDGVYINRPHQKRGVVQKDKIQTLKTSPDTGVVVGTYQYSKSDNFMQGKPRFQKGKEVSDTLQTTPKEGVVYNSNNIYNLLFTIFDLCCTINKKEKDKYERSRELLQILWQEIGKKEIWEEIRRFVSIQEKEILQSNLYENGIYEDRKLQSKVSTSTSNSSEYNESITNREEMLNMWEDWKTRYTPQRWELSEQQFRQFNLFMQELSYETTQKETSMQNMWQTNERFRILQQTLFKIQEIWRPIENQISNGLRIRKLTPRETFRLMGVKDEDYEKLTCSNSQKYKQAGNSIVVNVLMAIFKELI